MYDQRLKAQRDYQWGLNSARQEGLEEGLEKGREKGREEGLEKGREEGMEKGEVVGKIQLLQELLGDELTSAADLRKLAIDELSTMLGELQQRLRSRES